MANRKYYTLVSKSAAPSDIWAIEFGDYDRETVKEEMRERRYQDTLGMRVHHSQRIEYKIITTNSDAQAEIDLAVAELNK
jgi:hypothetical protein